MVFKKEWEGRMLRLQKEKEEIENYTYNMAESQFFGKNKEIFRHGSFVEKSVPYLFLLLGLCSAVCLPPKPYGFVMPKPYGFS